MGDGQLFLLFAQGQGFRLVLRPEALLAEGLYDSGAAVVSCLFLPCLIGGFKHRQFSVRKALFHVQSRIIAVVIVVLPVGGSAVKSPFSAWILVHRPHGGPIDDRLQSQVPEIFHRFFTILSKPSS